MAAERLHMEVDSADVSVHATGNPKDVNPTTQPQDYADATLQGTATRNSFRWNVFPVDGAPPPSVKATCQSTSASDASTLQRVPYVNAARPPMTRSIGAALAWSGCIGVVEIAGSFVLSLWKWNATLTANGQTQDVQTGPQQSPLLPAAVPDMSQIFGRDVEVYLYVTNGRLMVPLGMVPPTLLTDGDANLGTTGLALESAVGSLDVGGASTALTGNHLVVSGNLAARLAGRGTSLPITAALSGDGEAVVDGHAIVPSRSSASPVAWLLWPVAGLALVAVLAWPTVRFTQRRIIIHRRQPGHDPVAAAKGGEYREWAYELVNQRRFAEALRQVDRARDLDPTDAEATFVRGLCLSGLNRIEQALLMHTEADLWLQQEIRLGIDLVPLRAENAYEAARCCASLASARDAHPHAEKAAEWLRVAVTLQASYAVDAATDVSLAPVLAKLQKGGDWWLQP
ncbi:MAG: hypothetical protein V4510_09060 [bacterium]